MTDLHYIDASEALRLMHARELSPVELTEAVIARAEAVEPVVNALCVEHFDEALELARAAEARYARGDARALEGLPVAIKDEEPIAGRPWSQGSLLYRDRIADETSLVAQRIMDAGGIVHARTTTPEFSCAVFTHSRLWGVTRNPWNPGFGVGGSSGGSGAALAAGTALLASGSDIGGSIRVPASFNGVVGFKPPYGRVPQSPPFNLDTFCHSGPMARTVADCALLQNVLAGPHPLDGVSLRPRHVLPSAPDGVAGLRVALSPDLGDWPVDPDVRANTLAAADALRDAGAVVEEVDLQLPMADVLRAVGLHYQHGFGAWIQGEIERDGELMNPYVRQLPEWYASVARGGSVHDGHVLEASIHAALGALFERYDALVCPCAGTRGFVAGDDYVEHGIDVGGHYAEYHLEAVLTPPFNIASRCPVLAVPSGFADNGVPTGIQIVGRTYDDDTVFRLGAAYERVRPWRERPEVAAAA